MNNFIYTVAIVSGILNSIFAFTHDNNGEALAWVTAVIWATSSLIQEKKYQKEKDKLSVIEELVEKTSDSEELGNYLKELHK